MKSGLQSWSVIAVSISACTTVCCVFQPAAGALERQIGQALLLVLPDLQGCRYGPAPATTLLAAWRVADLAAAGRCVRRIDTQQELHDQDHSTPSPTGIGSEGRPRIARRRWTLSEGCGKR